MTMPNPTPEALVAKWREAAPTREDQFNDRTNTATADTLHRCADELEAALAAEGVQAGEVEQGLLANFQAAWFTVCDALDEADPDWMMGDKVGAEAAAAKIRALSQQPEARELLDARVIDSLINANEEIHAAAAELASCLAAAVAAGAGGILLTHRACMALKRHESLTELAPKAEARGVVDEVMVERATMALLGKSHDTAPGVDWRCDRTWTVNKVRKHMRAALTAALAQQPGAVDEAMVERATLAYEAEVDGNTHSPNVPREAMRAALTAALTEARNG